MYAQLTWSKWKDRSTLQLHSVRSAAERNASLNDEEQFGSSSSSSSCSLPCGQRASFWFFSVLCQEHRLWPKLKHLHSINSIVGKLFSNNWCYSGTEKKNLFFSPFFFVRSFSKTHLSIDTDLVACRRPADVRRTRLARAPPRALVTIQEIYLDHRRLLSIS